MMSATIGRPGSHNRIHGTSARPESTLLRHFPDTSLIRAKSDEPRINVIVAQFLNKALLVLDCVACKSRPTKFIFSISSRSI